MEEPFYGNGAGVQMSFDFVSSESQACVNSQAWLAIPYHWYNIDAAIEAWLNCRRRKQPRSNCTCPLNCSVTFNRKSHDDWELVRR
jgi:hypothetical protein